MVLKRVPKGSCKRSSETIKSMTIQGQPNPGPFMGPICEDFILYSTMNSDHFDTKFQTCLVHNFVNIGPFLTKLAPIESP